MSKNLWMIIWIIACSTIMVAGQGQYRALSCFSASGAGGGARNRLPIPAENPANKGFIREADRMKDCMGVDADLLYSPNLFNALADPDRNEVVLGEPLLRHAERQGPEIVALGMGFILAHEYSHTFQFKMMNNRLERLGNSTPQIKLQADVLAGYYGGARLDEQLDNEAAIRRSGAIYIRAADSMGDYAFFSNSHHGTPAQRATATKAGFDAGRAQKYGDLDGAFGNNGKELFEWSRDRADEILRSSKY
jgi:hypothetical protein